MLRSIVTSFLFAAAAAAFAQAPDPSVVYTADAKGKRSVVVMDGDGANAATIYSTKGAPSEVDFAPGGGKVAFSDLGTLKVVSYTVSGSGVRVGAVTTLASCAGAPDFSPDAQRILYLQMSCDGPAEIREIDAGGGPARTLWSGASGVTKVAWLGATGDRFVYLREYPVTQQQEVRVVDLDVNRAVVGDVLLLTTDGAAFRRISELDVARTRNSLLLTLNFADQIRVAEYAIDTGTWTDYLVGVSRASLSADDGRVVYLDASGAYVWSLDLTTMVSSRLTKRGSYGFVDAKP